MPELFVFLFKVNLSLLLFCLAYYGILRRLTFYSLNRIFLLAGIVFSSVYPFVDFTPLFSDPETMIIPIALYAPAVAPAVEQVAALSYTGIIETVFWAGVVFMGVRMAIRFLSLYRIHKGSTPGKVDNFSVRLVDGEIGTFSFWQNIYINPSAHAPAELGAILEHENVHIKQWHTLDILLAELTTVLYWFNPGVWYMRKAVKENIEFVTDQKILQKGIDRKAYQYSMVHAAGSYLPSVLMNNFNLTAIKRRIIMMNSKRSSGIQLVRYVFIIPVLVLVTVAFTLIRAEQESPVVADPAVVIKSAIHSANVALANKPVTIKQSSGKNIRIKKVKDQLQLPTVLGPQKPNVARVVVMSLPDSAVKAFKVEGAGSREDLLKAMNSKGAVGNVIIRAGLTGGRMIKTSDTTQGATPRNRTLFFSRKDGTSGTHPIELSPVSLEQFKTFINDREASNTSLKGLKTSDIVRIELKNVGEDQQKSYFIYTRELNN